MIHSERLPALREDLVLQPATRARDGAPQWNVFDPARNCFFRIGWTEFELISRWTEDVDIDQLCATICAQTPLLVESDDVVALGHFLRNNELLRASQPSARNALLASSARRRMSAWKWLLHHYLFFRIPLFKPDAFLARTLPFIEPLFRPTFHYWVAALSMFGLARAASQWDEFQQTFLYFFSWQGVACYGLALTLTKTLHELGHAYAARHFGVRVPTIGVAFMVMWPLLYTDTSEGWKLPSRRSRLAIDSAGVIAELCLAGLALLAWSLLPEGPLRGAAYVLAAVTWVSTLLINLNPFMRFDGYYLLMDAVDVPNLQHNSFAFGKWHLRKWLLGIHEDVPRPEYAAKTTWLVGYAYATWTYRLVLFTGIALAVYHYFFKALGVVLFAVEIGWFVLLPVWREFAMWRTMRSKWRGSATAQRSIALAGLAIAWLLVPWRYDIVGQGHCEAFPNSRLFSPAPARLIQVAVSEGQAVHKGDVLFILESPESNAQLAILDSRIEGIKSRLAGSVGNGARSELRRVIEQQLAAAEAEHAAEEDNARRLQIVAPHDGVFRDLSAGLYAGAWTSPKQALGRIQGVQGLLAHVYVSEAEIARVKLGARATLVTNRPDAEATDAVVIGIDEAATRALPEPMLASTHGGEIGVRGGQEGGELIPNEAIYRVTLSAQRDSGSGQATPLVAHIEGEHRTLLGSLIRWLAGAIVRESGF